MDKLLRHLLLFVLVGLITYWLPPPEEQERLGPSPNPPHRGRWLPRFLGLPWWEGIGAILNVVTAIMTTYVAIFLFQLQQQQEDIQRRDNISHISVYADESNSFILRAVDENHDIISDQFIWIVDIKLINNGPAIAPFVSLLIQTGQEKIIPVEVTQIATYFDIFPRYRAHIDESIPLFIHHQVPAAQVPQFIPYKEDVIPDIVSYGGCEHTITITQWQVDETISIRIQLQTDHDTNLPLSSLHADPSIGRREITRQLVPSISIYEHKNLVSKIDWPRPGFRFLPVGGGIGMTPVAMPRRDILAEETIRRKIRADPAIVDATSGFRQVTSSDVVAQAIRCISSPQRSAAGR